MKDSLHNYDVFPKVFPAGKEITVTVKPLGAHADFEKREYRVDICPLNQGTPNDYPHFSGFRTLNVSPDDDGCIRVTDTFNGEQEHYIRIYTDEKKYIQLSVFSLDEDLCGLYPFVGDLHMHTCRSDGRQAPAIVAANYRRHGYDFLAITDHRRYYPSLEAINAFRDVPIEFNLVTGEEVHMPKGDEDHINDVHIVNFGGKYSVNALVKDSAHNLEVGEGKDLRSLDGCCPETMTKEEFWADVDEYMKTVDIPEGVEPFAYACCKYIFDEIRKADGLGIFAHPTWISNVFQVPAALTKALFKDRCFDAFEVLGGESYYEQNGYQTLIYYEEAAKGNRVPIVGSTDSHSSINNRNGFICSTMVFAPENTREEIIKAVKGYKSVAIDTISTEHRMVGPFRLVNYANFLYREFFPLHDELCYEEGRLMKGYVTGEENAAELLKAISGRMKKQREKYFAF